MEAEALYNYNDLMQQMLQSNAQYLLMSISIILGTGAFFYLINLRPYQDKIDTLTSELNKLLLESKALKDQNENLSTEFQNQIKYMESKIQVVEANLQGKFETLSDDNASKVDFLKNDIETKLKLVDDQLANIDLLNEFRENWIWSAPRLPINAISSLCSSLEKISTVKQSSVSISLILSSLARLMKHDFDELKKNKSDSLFTTLSEQLSKLPASEHNEDYKFVIARLEDLNKENAQTI